MIVDTIVRIAKRFPKKMAPTIKRPIVKKSMTYTGLIWIKGSKATATPATPPVKMLLGKIKNETAAANIQFPKRMNMICLKRSFFVSIKLSLSFEIITLLLFL